MNITDIIKLSGKPALYEKGTAFMWTDKHISKELLSIHLNPDIDLASRKNEVILKTVSLISEEFKNRGKLNILDLGCGPGLYTEQFAQMGHSVTGVDISETSVEYAKYSSKEKGLDIQYIHTDYLELDPEADQYDLVLMIYTDFGVLLPNEREVLLNMIRKVLKKGGLFIFDVLRDSDPEQKMSLKDWEVSESGFWRSTPYLALSESFLYEEEKVILYQHILTDSNEVTETYRFWTHLFSEKSIRKILEAHNFVNMRFRDDVIPPGDSWSGENVLFCMTSK